MKKFFLFIVCFSFNFGISQIVYIPDVNFKAKLLAANININTAGYGNIPNVFSTKIDTNNDGEIEISEAQTINYLLITNSNISDLTGIQAFTNLTFLRCDNNNLSNVDISQLTSLETLIFYNNQLTSLNISYLLNLKNFDFRFNQIPSLNFANNPLLEKVFCSNNQLTNLDFSNNPLFNELDCMNNPYLTSINISNGTTQLFGSQTYYNECWTGCPNLAKICADSFEINDLQTYLDDCGVDTSGIDINSSCALGNEVFVKNDIVFFPNPTSSQINIYSGVTIKNVSIIDMQGRLIFQQQLDKNNATFDLSAYSNGVYFVKLTTDDGIKTEKIIKK